ncbi:hypothetical protein PENTCL1PPCAC_939, partial [Pristionchus entomophagus]
GHGPLFIAVCIDEFPIPTNANGRRPCLIKHWHSESPANLATALPRNFGIVKRFETVPNGVNIPQATASPLDEERTTTDGR